MSEQTKDAAREAAWLTANEATPMGVAKFAFMVGYDAGYAARDAEVCVWTKEPKGYKRTGCERFLCLDDAAYCPGCGRRVSVKESEQ